ncbi:hypothetical protein [Terracoccus sp. 273MFTsu3.1]|uniref:hypothetical protein n=1 Tax=Terracoccus sp. 273MFTsu3.1 TaxID=1172188 RepID=UPI00036EEA18|nr:hypothetical protein [Terracoccus sp. 273MFTsu3.1]
MKIHATFISRKDAPKVPELVVAWDEYAIDEAPDAYAKDVETSIRVCGDDVHAHATVVIVIPESQVVEILNRRVVLYSGDIKEAS